MTEQKSSPRPAAPKTPARVNASTDGHLNGKQMRTTTNQKARDAAAVKVAAAWVELNQNEPLMVELLLPRELRDALGELAKAHAA